MGLARSGREPAGAEQGLLWVVSDVLCRGEAYGLIDRNPDPDKPNSWRALISLSQAARLVLGRNRSD